MLQIIVLAVIIAPFVQVTDVKTLYSETSTKLILTKVKPNMRNLF